ncbi:MAG: TIM-barrel domain-containing protein [Bacillota bacterium]
MNDRIHQWKTCGNAAVFYTAGGILEVSFPGRDTVRIRAGTGTEIKEEETFVVEKVPALNNVHAVEQGNGVLLSAGLIQILVGLDPMCINIHDKLGRVLGTPAPGALDFKDGITVMRFSMDNDEKIYGLGQDPMANLNQRDHERRMWQEWGGFRRSGNAGIPFFMSSKGYGILLNSSRPSRFAFGRAEVAEPGPPFSREWAPAPWPWNVDSGETHPDRLAILLDEGIMDLFIICRDSLDDILAGYYDLTGHAPLPPKWALGFIQCKNRYRNQDELLYIAKEFRRRQIPCDVLVIDWLWFKEFGDLEWHKKDWPDPQGMLKELAEMGFHVLQAQHPFIDTNSLKYEEFKKRGYLNRTPEGARPTYDHSNPEARKAWWNEIRRLYRDGIRGYWTDMGELEVHPPGTESYLGPRERVHNIYSTLWTKGLYENQRKDFPERVFSLPRTAYAGSHRYGTALWSGDISSTWEVYRDQVVVGQGVCLSGQQYWTTDIGGFIKDGRFDPELYIRWFQWGAFCPVFRTHGTRPGNEPWSFGAQAEKILTEFIKLRYRLMPYIYSCARKVTERGIPFMRAMCLDFPGDPVAVEQVTQFMFGPALLVAPVVERGARERRVYLPAGVWYDFWSGEKLEGKQWINAPAPLSRIPLYARAGSIIPMGPADPHTKGAALEKLEVHGYAGAAGSFELYEDDGLTYSYENGRYAVTVFSMDARGKVIMERVDGAKDILPARRDYVFTIHNGAVKADDGAVQSELDASLSSGGRLDIHLTLRSADEEEALITMALSLPNGWKLLDAPQVHWTTPAFEYKAKFTRFAHYRFTVEPEAEILPVAAEGVLKYEVVKGDKTIARAESFPADSGYAGRWLMISGFAYDDGKSMARQLPVEVNPDLPFYTDGKKVLNWLRAPDAEFNCFGYVDLPMPENNRGIGYAKCRIWAEKEVEGYIDFSAEPRVKLFINGEAVFESDNLVLPGLLMKPVTLKQGWNTCLVKLGIDTPRPYSGREFGFTFRITDREGKPLDGILYQP